MRLRILFILFLAFPFTLRAQNVEFTANVPTLVAMGNVFKVEFSVNKRPDRFIPPDLAGFNVIAGPSPSISQFNINGVRSESHAFTYVIVADKEGTFTIPPAQVIVDGQEYATKSVPFEVVQEDTASPQGAGSRQGGQAGQSARQPNNRPQGNEIADDDLLVRAVVDKTTVYKGEPVRVYFKVYNRVDLAGMNRGKSPSFNGFWVQELGASHYTNQNETYNGKVYNSLVVLDYLVYPQQAGELVIDQLELILYANILETRSRTLMDDFFGGFPVVKQVEKKAASQPVKINVREWPEGAPSTFNGAVGEFTMSADFENENFAANSASNYIVRISGSGNLPLIQAPKLELPSSFEQYNVKTTENLNRTAGGINGYRQFEYPIIPRGEGEFYVEPAHFSFFNPKTGSYQTLNSREVLMRVMPDSTGAGSISGGALVTGVSREELRLLEQDIRFIKLGAPHLTLASGTFMGSTAYFVILLLIIAAFVFALVYLQKRIKEMRNTEAVRGKRANKVALQRLKAAEGFMKEGNAGGFYEEMLKALWGYMGDKLNIPAAMQTKEIVREELFKRGVQQEYVNHYIELITSCEYAQYSPSGSGHMNEIYTSAVKAISKFESLIKKKKK